MAIITFKGTIADRTIQKINLANNDGSVGYRILKLQLFPVNVGSSTAGSEYESVIQIYKQEPDTTFPKPTLFSDNLLIAASVYFSEVSGSPAYVIGTNSSTVFDREVFNQDIFIAHENFHNDNAEINYYIEIESMKLDLNENTVVTLKDTRNSS
jgi:hypothetical protein